VVTNEGNDHDDVSFGAAVVLLSEGGSELGNIKKMMIIMCDIWW